MPEHSFKPTGLLELRARAALQLGGAAASKGTSAGAVDALAVLHTLASSPETAADALALLHELQVHQVELDLQAQELRESRAELESALRRQIDLYAFQPVGCFTVDRKLIIRELNLAGAHMLGLESDAACGLGLDTFFSTSSADKLQTGVFKAAQREAVPSATLEWRLNDGAARSVQAHFGFDPSGNGCLVVLTPTGGDPMASSPSAGNAR